DRVLADRDAPEDDGSGADRGTRAHERPLERPVRLRLELAGRVRGAGVTVVRERHAVTDEHLVLDLDTGAEERVARALAPRTDDDVPLDLDEGSDPRALAERAPVEIDVRLDHDVVSEHDVGDQAAGRVVRGAVSHRRRTLESRRRRPAAAAPSCRGRTAARSSPARPPRRRGTRLRPARDPRTPA